jgi:oligosaccharide repeat unit polymerase
MRATEYLTLYLLLFALAVNYLRFGDALYPPVLQAGGWFIAVLLGAWNQDIVFPLSDNLFFIVLNGVLFFGLGSYLVTMGYAPRKVFVFDDVSARRSLIASAMYWVSVIGLPFFALQSTHLAAGGPSELFLLNLRHTLVHAEPDGYGPLGHLVAISFVSCALEFYRHLHQTNRFRLCVSFATALAYSVLSTGRTFALLLFIMLAGVAMISRRARLKTILIRVGMALVIVFFVLSYALQKGMDTSQTFQDNLGAMSDHLKMYSLGYLPAFDQALNDDESLTYGEYTFRTVWVLSQAIGADVMPPSWGEDVQYVDMALGAQWHPVPIADQTVYQPYLKDFGMPAVLTLQLVLGMLHGYIYKRADAGEPFYLLAYAVALYPLCLQSRQDQYMTLLSLWIQMAMLLFLHFKGTMLRRYAQS